VSQRLEERAETPSVGASRRWRNERPPPSTPDKDKAYKVSRRLVVARRDLSVGRPGTGV